MSNAVKAQSWLFNVNLARSVSKNPTIVWRQIEPAETVDKGQFVVLNGNNIEEAGNADTELFGVAAASGDGDDPLRNVIPVYAGDLNNIFEGKVTGDISATEFPFICNHVIDHGAADETRVDTETTVTNTLLCIGPVPGDTLDDTVNNPRVYFYIHRSEYNLLVT